MSGGSKTTTTTQNTKTDPWAPAQPALQQILAGASAAYSANPTAQVYQGNRVAGLGSDTLSGLDAMKSGAAAGTATATAGNGFASDLLAGGGTTAATRDATSGLAGINATVDTSGVAKAANALSDPNGLAMTTGAKLAGGAYDTDASKLGGLADGLASGPTQTTRSLQDVADGKFLGGANPYLDEMVSRASNSAASNVAQRFAASGRYGSGRFTAALGDAVAGAENTLRYQDYDNERARQASAATAIDAANNARAGQAASLYQGLAGINQGNASLAATGANMVQGAQQAGLAGQQALAGLEADNVSRNLSQASALLSGAQSDRQAGLAGIAALPTIQDALTAEGRTQLQGGLLQDAARQDQIGADMDKFNETQDASWTQLGKLAGLAIPIAGLGGTSSGTTTQKVPQASFLQQLLGYGLAGASVASKFI
ncbi:hypothetical protein [Methylobacterium organophilum]|uniref:Uncharacterized protein n=1 Tax=Methylobacterium organophilum TaxID=410 RepID=A0ABQ4TG16_METOR|nr:hypothetical protein [Methylobacterium organophilum]GJE29810.1 hypothetical protein LKMONMHP_4696 [Methylobacterium organophilum]